MKNPTRTAGFERDEDGGWSLWWLWALMIFLVSVYAFQRAWAVPCVDLPAGSGTTANASWTDDTHPLPPLVTPDRDAILSRDCCPYRQ